MECEKDMLCNQYCYGCLCKYDKLQYYTVQNESLKAIFLMDCLRLCFVCKRMARHAELFIQNVQSNQILLENYDNLSESTVHKAKAQTCPVMTLSHVHLDNIELSINEDENIEEPFSVIYNTNREVKIKEELKEEDGELLDHLEGEFIDDDNDFQDAYVKDEEFSLKQLLKEELEYEDIDLKCLRELQKKKKVKKKHKMKEKVIKEETVFSDDYNIELIYITRERCMEERAEMAQNKKYLNSLYKCEDCLKGFSFKDTYDKHMEKHSKSKGDYECEICKQRMSSEEKLLSHKRYHEVRYKCNECGLLRISRLTIKDHYTAYHCNGKYQHSCPHCLKGFKRQVSLRKHIAYLHNTKARVTCAFCNKTYVNKEVLKTHMVTRHPKEVSAVEVSKKHICQECGKAFKAPSQLKKHSIKHSPSRDYYCVECDKSFKSDAILKHHLKTASPHVNYIELPLQCMHCDKRFAIRRDLERHTNRVHLNIKPFQCDRCDKAYVNGWSLNEHKRMVHEGYKRPLKYPCPMCDKVFDRNQILKGHIRTHTGERPYQCSKCPAQFSQASILGTHIKLIHLKLTRDGRPKAVAMK